MKIFITDKRKAELEHFHDTARDGRVRDRIKAILLASEGWTSAMIAQALRLYQTIVDHHISEFLNKGKLKPENGGSENKLNAEQTALLISQLSDSLFHHVHEIIAFVTRTWGIAFSIPGMNKWLYRKGFRYEMPSGTPHKFSEVKQQQFIEYYENLKIPAGDEPILFLDVTYPIQVTKITYGWIRKGYEKPLKTTGNRTRLNILGALNPSDFSRTIINDYKTINDYNIAIFFNEIRRHYPDYGRKIHLIVNGAGYNSARLVKDWACVVNIELHFLPLSSPNLNPIEHLWKVMNEYARNNRYFEKKSDSRASIFTFFKTTLPRIGDSLTGRIHDRFQVLKSAS